MAHEEPTFSLGFQAVYGPGFIVVRPFTEPCHTLIEEHLQNFSSTILFNGEDEVRLSCSLDHKLDLPDADISAEHLVMFVKLLESGASDMRRVIQHVELLLMSVDETVEQIKKAQPFAFHSNRIDGIHRVRVVPRRKGEPGRIRFSIPTAANQPMEVFVTGLEAGDPLCQWGNELMRQKVWHRLKQNDPSCKPQHAG